ncbi:MAG: enolase C-terminal domain-like protein [Acidobacteriota bacterium]
MQSQGLSRRRLLAAAGLVTLPPRVAGAAERLRITKVELFRVAVPMQPDIVHSPEIVEADFTMVPKFILKVHTDSGIVGIGETARGEDGARLAQNTEFLRGKNILELNLTRLELPARAGYTAIEMALYDIVGKAVGWPVWRLLGGLAQPKVLVGYWCGRKNAADMRRVAQRAVAGKFTSVKMKCALGDPVVEAVQAIHDVSPALKVIFDPNTRFKNYATFLPVAKALDAIGNVLVMEDPFDKNDLAGYRELRRQVKAHVTLHLADPRAMIQAIKAEACSVFNTGPAPGMAGFVANCYLAAAAGMPVWHGSGHDLGICDAAYLHSCAAAANCTLPSDILSYQRVDDLLTQPIEIRDSYAIVPNRPGLGFELDEDAVRRYQVKG